jgi:dTDP-4-amino-4,6-dideoxygalactose transaminase
MKLAERTPTVAADPLTMPLNALVKPERIPLLDLKAQYHVIKAEAALAFAQIAESTAYAQGPAAKAFEDEFAAFCGVDHCVGVNTGTSALHLALRCLDIGPGDEVITVPMTFIATAWAVYYVGAKPVFVDIDPVRRTMDPAQLEKAITPKTKAIIPVHLYGQMADMAPILEIAERHGIPVIEDAAQAHGASYHGLRAGAHGCMSCFSFYPGKNLGAMGEGGALVTHDQRYAERARQLRNHAQSERYHHDEVGYNYRMDSLQAAILSLKLKHLHRWNVARAFRAQRYNELLEGLPLILPQKFADSRSVWHCYVIESDERDRLREALTKAEIESGLHYPVPLHLQKACADLGYQRGDFPHSEQLGQRCLSLPIFAELTDDQVQRVANTLRAALS